MNINDFEGQSKFKYLFPTLYVLSWTSMFLGPRYFAYLYSQYCLFLMIYLLSRSLFLCILNIKLILNTNKLIQRINNDYIKKIIPLGQALDQIYHAFIIPSYKQDIELLTQTLDVLAQHKRASANYLVFLAMEKHQPNSHEKAQALIQRFNGKFRSISYTIHEQRPYQQKGKASNVSWCAQKMSEMFKQLMIDQQSVFVTIMDADSWAPDVYLDQVQDHIRDNYEQRHWFIYQAPQIYTRNNFEVPIIIRTYDDMYSSMHASNLISCSGISFPLSNYTLSYNLIKSVGFWDTCQEAIGQDMHMTLKIIRKTKGKVQTIPIYAPFNQLNIQVDGSIFQNIKAKFWQVQRHSRGVADVGYCLNMILKQQQINWRILWTSMIIMQAFLLPIVIPWCFISAFYQENLLPSIPISSTTIQPSTLLFIFNLANVGSFISNLFYQYFKRRISYALYGIKNGQWWRMLQGSFFYGINLVAITIPAFVVGTFGNLRRGREYVVASKKLSMAKQYNIPFQCNTTTQDNTPIQFESLTQHNNSINCITAKQPRQQSQFGNFRLDGNCNSQNQY